MDYWLKTFPMMLQDRLDLKNLERHIKLEENQNAMHNLCQN